MTTQLETNQTDLTIIAESWPEKADSIVVTSQEEYDAAGFMVLGITGLESQGEAEYGKPKELTNAAHKNACSNYNNFMFPLKTAKKTIRRKMGEYEQAEERKRLEVQRRLEEVARKAAEEEALAAAIALEEAGETEAAEQVMEAPTPAPIIQVQSTVKKVEGVRGTQVRYRAELDSLYDLACFVVKNPALLHYIQWSETELNRAAVRQKDTMNVPGVRSVSVRS